MNVPLYPRHRQYGTKVTTPSEPPGCHHSWPVNRAHLHPGKVGTLFTISSDFIGSFKTGDNINFNLRTLRLLYSYYGAEDSDGRRHLRKPITIVLVSITEAMLADFYMRVQNFTTEGVTNLDSAVVDDIRAKKLDKLEHFIASVRKHRIFGDHDTLYEQLDELRNLRNKVHIQGRSGQLEADEHKAFSPSRMKRAEETLEYIGKYLSINHARRRSGYVDHFICPWEPHWDAADEWR